MTISLTKRSTKGSALTHNEMDQNWTDIETDVNGLGTAATEDTGTTSGTIPIISETSVNLTGSGDISSGTLYCYKVGSFVVLTWNNLAHSSSNAASTVSGAIPSDYRPTAQITNVYLADITAVRNVTVTAAGLMSFSYHDWAGSTTNKTATGGGSIAFYKY